MSRCRVFHVYFTITVLHKFCISSCENPMQINKLTRMNVNYRKNIIQDNPIKGEVALSEELCCPVCEMSLARHPSPRPDVIEGNGNAATAMRNEIREIRAGKFRDSELIVAAPCGHIFHRFCLRHYCFIYQQAHNTETVECPVCMQTLSMIKFQTIDFKAHIRVASKSEQQYTEAVFVNEELHQQKAAADESIDKAEKVVLEAKVRLENVRNHQENMTTRKRSVKLALEKRNHLRSCIEKCNQGINSMHKENLNIIKMYLSIMKEQPEDVLRDKRIPQPLIPYLAIILADEKLVKKFGEILKPVEIDGIQSNEELLIKEILADVRSKSQSFNNGPSTLEKRHTTFKPIGKPVVVKVQRSMVSIFSRSALDKESLKNILLEVKGPINKLHDAHHKFTTTKQKQKTNNNNNSKQIRRSVSDIQVLFESRRKQHESGSAPPLDSDTEFLKTVPLRRCKSTEPILMKARGRKTVVVKVNELKQLEYNAVGDGKAFTPLQEVVTAKRSCSDITLKKSPSAARPMSKPSKSSSLSLPDTEDKLKCRISNHDDVYGIRTSTAVNPLQLEQLRTAKDQRESKRQNFSAGFVPSKSGSVFEMLYDDDAAADNNISHLTSLVDDVSKITFNAFKRVPCQAVENDDVDGNVSQPVIEYSVSLPKKVTTSTNTDLNLLVVQEQERTCTSGKNQLQELKDIESGLQTNEELDYHQSNSSGFIGNASRKTSGVLQGILPGPYLNVTKCHHHQEESFFTATNKKMPVYQSKWLTKLPSTRTDNISVVQPNCDPFTNTQPVERVLSNRITNVTSMKHTVINIPSSNTIINLPPVRNGPSFYNRNDNNSNVYENKWGQSHQPQQQRLANIRFSNSDMKPGLGNLSQPQNQWSQHQAISRQTRHFPHHYFGQNTTQAGGDRYTANHTITQGITMTNNANMTHGEANTANRADFVEQALVELCRGLSPPRSPRGRKCSTADIQHQYHDGHQTWPSAQISPFLNSTTRTNHHRQATSMMICPDGISPRMIRRAKKRQHINV